MSQVKAFITSLVQNPGLLRSLVEDPQALLAGLGENELKSLRGVGTLVSGILNRIGGPSPCASALPADGIPFTPADSAGNDSRTGGAQGVAIAGVVALGAIAGAVATVATVSIVALARDDGDQIP